MAFIMKRNIRHDWFENIGWKHSFLFLSKILIGLILLILVMPPSVRTESSPALDDAIWHEFDWSDTGDAVFNAPDSDTLYIDMKGRGMWTNSDQYAVYYLADANGDFTAEVEIKSQTNTDDDAMAGIMVRNDITGDGLSTGYCVLAMTPGNGVVFRYDGNDNGMLESERIGGSNLTYSMFLKLNKTGNTFTAFYKHNQGDAWSQVGTSGIVIDSALTIQDVGLFVTSSDHKDRCTVEFDDFVFTGTIPTTSYTIEATAGDNGAIDPSGTVSVNEGVDAVFNIVPDTGYTIDTLKVGGVDVAFTGNQYTIPAADVPTANSIAVTFTPLVLNITASVNSGSGTISPSGAVPVAYGDNQIFTVTPAEGYEVQNGEVLVNGSPVRLNNDKYTFKNVYTNHSISVTFVSSTASGGSTIPGCASSTTTDYSAGFLATDFDANNVTFSGNEIVLETGNAAIDPDNIIIPYEQEVAVTFLYEGAGYESDFGWILKEDAVDENGVFLGWNNIPLNKKHVIFRNIYDDDETGGCCDGGDGIFDSDYGNGSFPESDETALAAYDDGTGYPFMVDGDGSVTPKDMKKNIGTFAPGTEIIFFLTANKDWDTTDINDVFFTKTEWNPDVYGTCVPDPSDDNWIDESNGIFHKDYKLGVGLASEGGCAVETNGWLSQTAIDRLASWFDVTLNITDEYQVQITDGATYSHVVVGAPENQPDQWILGMEDVAGGGDADTNDMVFRIERQTGGVATLSSNSAVVPTLADAYFTAVEFEVYDNMPGSGATEITYYLSIDNGEKWVEITEWDTVIETDASKNHLNEVAGWTPGSPQYTYRTRRVDFSGLGLSGRSLIWRAALRSDDVAYTPSITGVELNGSVASHGSFSRSSPIVKANMLYAGSYETADMNWAEKEMRGHLTAIRLYDPTRPSDETDADGVTDLAELWDAGDVLSTMTPSTRNLKFPNITITEVPAFTIDTGDGSEKTFSGTLPLPDGAHIVAESITITGSCVGGITETFTDKHTDVLAGDKGGEGTINRSTGEGSITFNAAPDNGAPITVSYSYYIVSQTLLDFTPANLTNAMLGIDDTFVYPDGYKYDFDESGSITENDGDWLADWVRGYEDGNNRTTTKDWLLGPVDHSVPALETPPGTPPWYFGTSVPVEEREAFDTFMANEAERNTVVFVGSRDGMLHAFDAGKYRQGNNPETDSLDITEQRGYFLWEAVNTAVPTTDFDFWWESLLNLGLTANFGWTGVGTGGKAPNYGTGKELWAFIPDNLIARFKNNYLKAEDQSYVDASPALSDVYIDIDGDDVKEWRTVLLCAEGNGGDTIFCLDVTDPENPTFLWEFADPDLFRSRSSPAVGQIGRIYDAETDTAKWIAFFVSGKTEDHTLYPSIYMIDIEDGSVVQRVVLDEDTGTGPNTRGQGGVPSGQPAIIDADYNGYHDRMYIGTNKGFMYKVTLPDDPDSKNNEITHCVINDDFDVDDDGTDDVDAAQQYHPVYGSPVALIDNIFTEEGKIDYRIRIFFGTGDSPYYDENINVGNTRYHFFAYLDQGQKDDCGNVVLDWAYELPEGHRIFSTAFAAAGQVYFGTSTAETEDPCDIGISGNPGRLFALTVEGTVILNKEVGNVSTTPLVEDEHLYYLTPDNGLSFLGSGQYNNEQIQGGEPEVTIQQWRIVE